MSSREPVPMTPQAREAFTRTVSDALADRESEILIERVKGSLLDALEQGSFNTERARQLFCMAIEKSVWKKHKATGAVTTRAIRGCGIIESFAERYIEEFKASTGATDQRVARRGLFAKIIGR
jgi:hypothetical protein